MAKVKLIRITCKCYQNLKINEGRTIFISHDMNFPSSLLYDLKFLTILGPFTLFAPSDAAFAKISSDVMTKLSHDKDLLAKVIKYHVAAGKQLMSSFSNDIEIGSWENGYKIRINRYHNGQARNLSLNMTNGFT